MNEWKWTSTQHKARPEIFRVVKGTPLDVEIQTNKLIKEGFVLNGNMMDYIMPGTNTKIFVQAMVKYHDANKK